MGGLMRREKPPGPLTRIVSARWATGANPRLTLSARKARGEGLFEFEVGALVEGSAEHGLYLIAELERGGGSFVLLEGFVALPHFVEKEMIGAVELNERSE